MRIIDADKKSFDKAIERISRPMVDATIIRCKDCKYWNRRAPRCDRVKGPNGLGAFGFGAYNGCGEGERIELRRGEEC